VIGDRTGPGRSFAEEYAEVVDRGWRGEALAAGVAAEQLTPQLEADRALRALVARVGALDRALYVALDSALDMAETELYDAGVRIGYALRSVRDACADDRDRWPAVALTLARMETAEYDPGPAQG
jgi:hypothetical protein